MDKRRIPEGVSPDQLKEVLAHLVEKPVKVSLRKPDGTWSFWTERAVGTEARRTTLREAEIRYRHELMDDVERMLLWDRILKLRRALGLAQA